MRSYLFVDDGLPEAGEYESNYVSYIPGDPDSYRSARAQARLSAPPARVGIGLARSMTREMRPIPIPASKARRAVFPRPSGWRGRKIPAQPRLRVFLHGLLRLATRSIRLSAAQPSLSADSA